MKLCGLPYIMTVNAPTGGLYAFSTGVMWDISEKGFGKVYHYIFIVKSGASFSRINNHTPFPKIKIAYDCPYLIGIIVCNLIISLQTECGIGH